MRASILAALVFCLCFNCPILAQNSVPSGAETAPRQAALTYADLADLALSSRLVAAVKVRQATRLKGADAVTMLPGRKRFLIVADVLALIRSTESIPPRITYVIDVAPDSSGKTPKLTKGEAIVFAVPVAGYPNELRLVSPDAQIAATPDNLARVRAILKEDAAPSSPPKVLGVGTAFHSRGAIPGEGETQIFLQTADERQVSLAIVRTGSLAASWAVSVGESVDEGAMQPKRNSLLWYKLACFLPQTLPLASVESQAPELAAIASEDYLTVINGLGACPRSLKIRPKT